VAICVSIFTTRVVPACGNSTSEGGMGGGGSGRREGEDAAKSRREVSKCDGDVSSRPESSSAPLKVPFQSPLDFRVTASTFHSVTLEWDTPPLASRNGILTHYSLTYTCINSAASPCNHSRNETRVVPVDRRRTVETVDDLIPYTQYWFQISAATRAGEGPAASLLCNTTQAALFKTDLMQQFVVYLWK
jgi:hypothetical protein